MALQTTIKSLETVEEVKESIANNERMIICAGRWGPMCIPVYRAMEEMERQEQYNHIAFRVIDFDTGAVRPIKEAKECRGFMGLPFTVYYHNGAVVHATSSIQTKQQLEDNIQQYLQ